MYSQVIAGALHGSTDRKAVPAKAVDTQSNLKTIWDAEVIVVLSMLSFSNVGSKSIFIKNPVHRRSYI